jgi:predicted acyl esterase
MQTTVEPLPRPEMGGALAVGLRRVDEVLIRMRDGVELAANVCLSA